VVQKVSGEDCKGLTCVVADQHDKILFTQEYHQLIRDDVEIFLERTKKFEIASKYFVVFMIWQHSH